MESREIVVNGLKIVCHEDGSVTLPKNGTNREHRTFGSNHGNSSKDGYLAVNVNGRSYRVHRLICEAFHENPNGFPEVDHIDRDRRNNRQENLRWASRSINCRNTSQHDKAAEEVGMHTYEGRAEYNLKRSRLYEQSHTRIRIINAKGTHSNVICTEEEKRILAPLKPKDRRAKLEELRNGL